MAAKVVAKQQGYNLLLERELPGVLYMDKQSDITQFVIARVNEHSR